MTCPHCKHPFTDEEVFDILNKAVSQRAKNCEHNFQPDVDPDNNPIHACAKCGVPRPWEVS